MPLVRTIRSKGANIVVTAQAERLFLPGESIPAWTRRLSRSIEKFTAEAAPTNKRPRWGHYGKPLKQTFKSAARSNPAKMRVDFAVGSTALHSVFVDQGTGAFEAKILPPWTRGGASLYEHTWIPPGSKRPLGTILVNGQKGQHFFEKGINRGFASMQVPPVSVPGVLPALATFPDQLANFIGATPADAAFVAQLEKWRAWRDKAWDKGKVLGGRQGGAKERARRAAARKTTKAKRAAESKKRRANSTAKTAAERGRAYRERMALAKGKAKPKPRTKDDAANKRRTVAQKKDLANFKAAMVKKYGRVVGAIERRGDYWYATVPTKDDRGRNIFKEVRGKAKS